jgi:hypothetical protein
MNDALCPRAWEVEAAHHGQLDAAQSQAHAQHLAQCARCAHGRQQLLRFSTLLRAEPEPDALLLRRVRHRVLSGMPAVGSQRNPARLHKLYWALASVVMTTSVAAGAWLHAQRSAPTQTAATLRLSPDANTRYVHEQRAGVDYVQLHEGALGIAFVRRSSGGLIVRVPDGEIRDLGTVFRVVVAAGHTNEISVQQGLVVFHREQEPDIVVAAGQVYLRPPDETPASATAPAPPVADAKSDAAAEPAAALAVVQKPKAVPHKPKAKQEPVPAHPAHEPQDIDYLRLLALLQEGRRAEAHVAAQAYLARYPDGFRRYEVSRVADPVAP